MSAETYAEVFKAGFYFSFVMWLLAFFLVGRRYWAAVIRYRQFNPFLVSALCVGTLSLCESGFYIYILHVDPSNLEIRRIGGIALAYGLGINALIFIVFGLIALHRPDTT